MDRIVVYPDPVLREPIPECRLSSKQIKKITERLTQVMTREKHGIGIAAPQIGIRERIAIVDVSARVPECQKMVLINPVILETRDPDVGREGCMSVPDYTALVKRYRWIRFRYMDLNGMEHEKISSGIEAICVQHEIDHLNGKLLVDAVACLKTDLLPRRISKLT